MSHLGLQPVLGASTTMLFTIILGITYRYRVRFRRNVDRNVVPRTHLTWQKKKNHSPFHGLGPSMQCLGPSSTITVLFEMRGGRRQKQAI